LTLFSVFDILGYSLFLPESYSLRANSYFTRFDSPNVWIGHRASRLRSPGVTGSAVTRDANPSHSGEMPTAETLSIGQPFPLPDIQMGLCALVTRRLKVRRSRIWA
jgi:hypothetical protein